MNWKQDTWNSLHLIVSSFLYSFVMSGVDSLEQLYKISIIYSSLLSERTSLSSSKVIDPESLWFILRKAYLRWSYLMGSIKEDIIILLQIYMKFFFFLCLTRVSRISWLIDSTVWLLIESNHSCLSAYKGVSLVSASGLRSFSISSMHSCEILSHIESGENS